MTQVGLCMVQALCFIRSCKLDGESWSVCLLAQKDFLFHATTGGQFYVPLLRFAQSSHALSSNAKCIFTGHLLVAAFFLPALTNCKHSIQTINEQAKQTTCLHFSATEAFNWPPFCKFLKSFLGLHWQILQINTVFYHISYCLVTWSDLNSLK